jgi:hypothetical protein
LLVGFYRKKLLLKNAKRVVSERRMPFGVAYFFQKIVGSDVKERVNNNFLVSGQVIFRQTSQFLRE